MIHGLLGSDTAITIEAYDAYNFNLELNQVLNYNSYYLEYVQFSDTVDQLNHVEKYFRAVLIKQESL